MPDHIKEMYIKIIAFIRHIVKIATVHTIFVHLMMKNLRRTSKNPLKVKNLDFENCLE